MRFDQHSITLNQGLTLDLLLCRLDQNTTLVLIRSRKSVAYQLLRKNCPHLSRIIVDLVHESLIVIIL